MPVPKRRTSKSRRDKRRTHQKLPQPNLNKCPKCQEPVLRHHVCPSCGYYRDIEVVSFEEIS